MSVESVLFRKEFAYNEKKCDVLILHIQRCRDVNHVANTKDTLFRMMGMVVAKNVSNYISLLVNSNCDEIPTRDEAIAIAFTIFESCVCKFKVGHGFNFYFYFNKSLSRAFFRLYQRSVKSSNNVHSVDFMEMNFEGKTNSDEEINLVIATLHLTDLEERVCWSKLHGENRAAFLEDNTDVTPQQYGAALVILKDKLKILIDER